MIKISLKNVYSTLSDYTTGLEKRLTVAYPNYWFSPKFKQGLWDGKNHFLKVPSLKFPTGLLFVIEEYFKEKNMEYEIEDLRQSPHRPTDWVVPDDMLRDIVLRDYQLEAIRKGLEKKRGIFEVATGLGKTEIAAGIIKALGLKTIFMTHTQDLLHQTAKRFELRLGEKTGLIGDAEFDTEPRIVVATTQSLYSLKKKRIEEFKKLINNFEVMFQDETHHSSSMTFYEIGMYAHNAYYRYGLSGTPLRRDELSNMKVMAITGPILYGKLAEKGIKEGYLSDIEIRIIDNPEMVVVAGDKWQQIYNQAIVCSPTRNMSIVDLAEKEFKLGKKILILIRIIEHGEILHRMFSRRKIDAAFIHGGHESSIREEVKKQFNKDGDFVLIASTIFSEGIDIPNVQVLIIGSGGKSEVQTIQRVGRGLRIKETGEKLIVYDFNDMNSKFLSTHSKERIKIYKQEGFLKE